MLPWSSGECRVRWPGAAPRCVRASYGQTKGKGDHEYAIRNRIVASDAVVHRQPGGQHLGHVAADRPHSVGWIFVRSGLGKLMDINAFIATMPGRGLPGWLGYVAAPVEFFGGIALILGL